MSESDDHLNEEVLPCVQVAEKGMVDDLGPVVLQQVRSWLQRDRPPSQSFPRWAGC